MGSALTDGQRWSFGQNACGEGGREGETEHITQRNAVGGRTGGPLTEGTKGEKSEIGSVGAEKKRRGVRTVLPVSPS